MSARIDVMQRIQETRQLLDRYKESRPVPQVISTLDLAEARIKELERQLTDTFTVRDQFAAHALAMLADPEAVSDPKLVATGAYQYADALLAERCKAGDQ